MLQNRMVQKAAGRIGRMLRLAFLLMICFVVLYPLIYMVSISLRELQDFYDPSIVWLPKHLTLDHYQYIWKNLRYPQTLLKTVLLVGISSIFNVGICSVIGYGFARFRFKGRGLLFGLMIFTIIVPDQSVIIPLYVQFFKFDFFGLGQLGRLFTGEAWAINLLNSNWSFYISALFGQGFRSGLFIYIFRQFFRGMPKELEDAAAIDGCGVFGVFLRVMAINASAAYISSMLFSTVWYWNDYFRVSFFFNDMQTLTQALSSLQSLLRSSDMDLLVDPYLGLGQTKAACVLVLLPLLLMYVALQRLFTESIDKTGIVG